ncbi:lasso peptide biosynthesis PqqD family chaperone [Paenibacillus sp. SI8]|uniref:lasso peptide biosynthesis PqqD family chaperone n=1 Tax=unclassified Paenibacillus TaxID=185978 RepID=UPI003465C8AD
MIKNKHVQLDDVIVQESGYIVSDMDGETVMLGINNGKYYNLGQIGGSIWSGISAPITVQDLVANLMAEYEVGQERCEEQVVTFLEQLIDEGLVAKQ